VSGSTIGLVVAAFLASAVEFVEALTIVLAMGITRGWKSALVGAGSAVAVLAVLTAGAGYALVGWLPDAVLQIAIGSLLLVFGLQWLRKAILRSAGLKALHDEEQAFLEEQAAARGAASEVRLGLDWFGFVVSFKGVFLEGLEVVFIVLTFGLNAKSIPIAAAGAGAAGVLVLVTGAVVHRPLSNVPENTLKYAVATLLTTFGTFWAIEGLGSFGPGSKSLEWPGGEWALLVLLATWIALSQLLVRVLRARRARFRLAPAGDA
jgi:uncharacterized membrane protein